MTRVVIALALLALLSACASEGMFSNRLMCRLDGSGAVIVSRWGGFGIASDVVAADAARICTKAPPQ